MKEAWVEAERVEEVRAAAKGWRAAGAVGEGTFEEILRRYPEPRTFPALVWRVLTFVLVSMVLLLFAAAFLAAASPGLRNLSSWCAFFGVAFVVLAELQARSRALALRGGVGAASLWGLLALAGAFFLFLDDTVHAGSEATVNLGLLGALVLFGLGAFRWGIPAYASASAAAAFVLLARAPSGRLLWIAGGVLVSALAERARDRPSWAPSHRRCAAAVLLCGIAAVYAAVNLWSLDTGAVESLRGHWWNVPSPAPAARVVAAMATALVPVLVFLRGVKSRRRVFLDAGLLLAALSLVTLRHYVHVAELWVVLSALGAALVLAALAVRRALDRAPDHERSGFTAEPLFDDAAVSRAVELAPVLAAHAPPARPAEEPGFSGGGGSFGGGGAGASY